MKLRHGIFNVSFSIVKSRTSASLRIIWEQKKGTSFGPFVGNVVPLIILEYFCLATRKVPVETYKKYTKLFSLPPMSFQKQAIFVKMRNAVIV